MTLFNWNTLLNPTRLSAFGGTDNSPFDADYRRIIMSPAFRRLQDKTQVFPLERGDSVRTRLTHSLEVATITREIVLSLCKMIEKKGQHNTSKNEMLKHKDDLCRIVESASLLHDIGNPPFGHFGEDTIRSWFKKNLSVIEQETKITLTPHQKNDFLNFEGNAQALRIITKLHQFSGTNGMDLTVATLNTIIKYTRNAIEPSQSDTQKLVDKKIGYFYAEQAIFHQITSQTGTHKSRHPLTFILESADDIAYLVADIEDAIKKEVIDFKELTTLIHHTLTTSQPNQHYNDIQKYITSRLDEHKNNMNLYFLTLRNQLIWCVASSFYYHYQKIMQGNYNADLFYGGYAETLHKFLVSYSIAHIYDNKHILKLEITGHTVLNFLLDKFVFAVIHHTHLNNATGLDKKIILLISDSHKKVYQDTLKSTTSNTDSLYYRLLMVTDFISGMTDSYAHKLYQELSGRDI